MAAPLKIMSTIAVEGALPAIVAAFKAKTGVEPTVEYAPTAPLVERIRQGAQVIDGIRQLADGDIRLHDRVRPPFPTHGRGDVAVPSLCRLRHRTDDPAALHARRLRADAELFALSGRGAFPQSHSDLGRDPAGAAFSYHRAVAPMLWVLLALMIIEAMKTMNQIPSPRAGTVTQILVEDGQPVGTRRQHGDAVVDRHRRIVDRLGRVVRIDDRVTRPTSGDVTRPVVDRHTEANAAQETVPETI